MFFGPIILEEVMAAKCACWLGSLPCFGWRGTRPLIRIGCVGFQQRRTQQRRTVNKWLSPNENSYEGFSQEGDKFFEFFSDAMFDDLDQFGAEYVGPIGCRMILGQKCRIFRRNAFFVDTR